MVIFSVNTLPGLANGTLINNRAGVYFDVNPVVMTNTVSNYIGCTPASVANVVNENPIEVYPNPATDVLILKLNGSDYKTLSIYNSMGTELMRSAIINPSTNIDISSLAPGVYYIRLNGSESSIARKFVKM
jgi:hypothetical protein